MSNDQTALGIAIKFISRNERFEGEVRKHLAAFEPDVVDEVVQDLKRRNILNDERAAKSYLRLHSGRKATGVCKMEYELRSKGVSDDVISLISNEVSEPDAAVGALAGKFSAKTELKQRGLRFLLSRGFSYESSHNAVRKYFDCDV